jgi:formylglycine-generating enzyme
MMTRSRWWACAALLAVVLSSLSHARQAVPPCEGQPLDESEFADLVKAGVPDIRLKQFVVTCGVDLKIRDGDWVRRLRELGAPKELVELLTPPARASAGDSWTSPADRREMRWIPAGSFAIGSNVEEPGRDPDEDVVTVTVERGFWLEATEVTNTAYQRFVLAHPEWQKASVARDKHDGNYLLDWTGNEFPAGRADFPVTWVSAFAAQAYAASVGKRLPTEAEWEYACRAGTTTTRWWGNAFNPRYVSPGNTPAAVTGNGRRNPWGLADMLGNVWEWTATTYGPYRPSTTTAATPDRLTETRVLRGGAAGNGPDFVRSANRNQLRPQTTNALVGFRCAL